MSYIVSKIQEELSDNLVSDEQIINKIIDGSFAENIGAAFGKIDLEYIYSIICLNLEKISRFKLFKWLVEHPCDTFEHFEKKTCIVVDFNYNFNEIFCYCDDENFIRWIIEGNCVGNENSYVKKKILIDIRSLLSKVLQPQLCVNNIHDRIKYLTSLPKHGETYIKQIYVVSENDPLFAFDDINHDQIETCFLRSKEELFCPQNNKYYFEGLIAFSSTNTIEKYKHYQNYQDALNIFLENVSKKIRQCDTHKIKFCLNSINNISEKVIFDQIIREFHDDDSITDIIINKFSDKIEFGKILDIIKINSQKFVKFSQEINKKILFSCNRDTLCSVCKDELYGIIVTLCCNHSQHYSCFSNVKNHKSFCFECRSRIIV